MRGAGSGERGAGPTASSEGSRERGAGSGPHRLPRLATESTENTETQPYPGFSFSPLPQHHGIVFSVAIHFVRPIFSQALRGER